MAAETELAGGELSQRDHRVIPDLDIYRAAKLLVDQHGEDAPLRAAERADELLETGDFEGAAIWRSILAAIEELQRGRLDGEAVN
jgi:hypothetical protein